MATLSSRQQNAFPDLATWKLVALLALLAVCVFALLYCAELVPLKYVVVKSVIQSFAALLLTSGIVSVIANLLVRREIAEFWLTAIGVREAVSAAGLWDIGLDFQSYDFHSLIRDATSIDLCVIHADKWIGSRLNDFKEFLSHKDHELRACLLHEGSEVAPVLSADFRYKPGDMEQRIGRSVEGLRSCIDDLEKMGQTTGWLRIWKHRRAPKYTYYRFHHRLFLVPYNLAAGHTKIPVFGFCRKDGGVSDFLATDFERMLSDHSEIVYDSRTARSGERKGA